jgi:uncharacterized protein YkwD
MATKRTCALLLVCCLLASWSGGALASGLRITSQFGNGGKWPNRQSAPCKRSSCSRAKECKTCSKSNGKSSGSVQATPAPTKAPATDGHYTIGSASAQELEALKYINEDRIREGLPALALDNTLSALARMKSQDMLANNYFAHTSPTLGDAAAMLRNNGYAFKAVGENISKHATVRKSHAALMSSDGHRKNILGSGWKKAGIGIAQDKNGNIYMTQLFVR